MRAFQDLTRAKSTITTLEESLASVKAELVATTNALDAASVQASPVKANGSWKVDVDKIALLESDLASAQSALLQTQEDAVVQMETISKIHDAELLSKDEDHSNTISNLKRDKAIVESKLQSLEDASNGIGSPPPTPSKRTAHRDDSGLAALHAAHEAKVSQLELELASLKSELHLYRSSE